jgi:cyclopropane-fatty-acyl-phospholipid synthase
MRILTLEHSKVSNILDFTFYITCVLLLALYLLINGSRQQLVGNLLFILAGLLSWTVIEYLLHRFVLHGMQPLKNWHIEHHKYPSAFISLPTLLSAALLLILVFLPVLFILGIFPACAVTLGVLTGYLTYTVVHHGIHHWNIDSNWFKKRKHWHDFHHYADQTKCYGVTSSFWDYVFVKIFHI